MSSLIILKFGSGSLETGFPVTLQIGPEGELPHTEINGSLPADLELLRAFTAWQQTYRRFDFSGAAAGRPIALKKQPRLDKSQIAKPRFSTVADCDTAAALLCDRLNHWLRSPEFLPLRETWLAKLRPQDSLRLVLQTQSLALQRLPWPQWDLLQRHDQAAATFSTPNYDRLPELPATEGVKLLALLGDSQGIDVKRDRSLVESLPDVEATFLIEPDREQLTHQLWQEPWQVLFFAGHSASLGPEAQGRMGINPQDSLTIGELKYALRNAVQRGLKLAIFNSCDGLGLARELAELQIPQLIVMGEPVPDRVAQDFLKHFLAAYTEGQPLHLAVRQARHQLKELEADFPKASWLPVIFQSLAETPPSWEELASKGKDASTTEDETGSAQITASPRRRWSTRTMATALGLSTAVAACTVGLRAASLWQPWELKAYDQLLTRRPLEDPDDRLLVITITEPDLAIQPERVGGSLTDASLLKILQILEPHNPAVIGLDIYRDRPVLEQYPALADRLSSNPRFISVCRTANSDRPDVAPPPEVSPDRLGFSDLLPDADAVHRRQLLAMTPPPESPCQTAFSLSSALALRYLGPMHNIALDAKANGDWQLGKANITPLQAPIAGYQRADTWGYQTLLNYRNVGTTTGTLDQIAPQLTLTQLFNGDFEPASIQDKVVLIGTTAESFKDYLKTPYSKGNNDLAGVIFQAQMTSQLISAALDGRSPIKTVSILPETLWILLWSLGGGLLAITRLNGLKWFLSLGFTALIPVAIAFALLAQFSLWLTVVPVMIGLGSSALLVRGYLDRES